MRRRDFIAGFGGAAAASSAIWSLAARAQQPALPVVALVSGGSVDPSNPYMGAFRRGLAETGYFEGRNMAIESHYLEGEFDRLSILMGDLVQRRVAVITSFGSSLPVIAAKATTATIPIVFGVAEDPVKLGLVASLARPGGNVTGMNFFNAEVVGKRLGLLHELVPKARRLAVFLNPRNARDAETNSRGVQEAARSLGLAIQILNASTVQEIDSAFADLAPERPDLLFVVPDAFFVGRRVQFATLAVRERIPAAFPDRIYVEAGGLMSYGSDFANMARQVGIYVGAILKGAKPADLPVQQSTRFEFVINLSTARALGIEVPPTLLGRADEVIE